jgi:tetratricopeptide (TPR) repeat protein
VDDGAGGSNTVSVNQFKVSGKARDAFKKAEAAAQKLKLDKAEKFLAKAFEIHPQYAEAMALRGILKLDNNGQGASSDLEQAVQFDLGCALSYIALAAHNTLERFDDALLTVDRGVALAPASWQSYFEMGKAYLGKGKYQEALKQVNKAKDLAPKQFAPIHLVRAHAMLGLKDYAEAMTELEAYLDREPKGPNSQQARDTLQKVRTFAASERKTRPQRPGCAPGLFVCTPTSACAGFFEHILRHFPERNLELEHGSLRAASPAVHFPVRAQKFNVGTGRKVDEHRVLPRIKFLREAGQRLLSEIAAVG